MAELIGAAIAFLGVWGSLWYKLGRLESEVKDHNDQLHQIQKQLEHIITTGGGKHG